MKDLLITIALIWVFIKLAGDYYRWKHGKDYDPPDDF